MINLAVLIIGLIAFAAFKIINWHEDKKLPANIIGSKIISKKHGTGTCLYITDGGFAYCVVEQTYLDGLELDTLAIPPKVFSGNDLVFYSKVSRLFWSEINQAFVER